MGETFKRHGCPETISTIEQGADSQWSRLTCIHESSWEDAGYLVRHHFAYRAMIALLHVSLLSASWSPSVEDGAEVHFLYLTGLVPCLEYLRLGFAS